MLTSLNFLLIWVWTILKLLFDLINALESILLALHLFLLRLANPLSILHLLILQIKLVHIFEVLLTISVLGGKELLDLIILGLDLVIELFDLVLSVRALSLHILLLFSLLL